MKYKIFDNRIEVYNPSCFDPKHICECGQMFRYVKNDDGSYFVCSEKNRAKITKNDKKYIIFTQNPVYFAKFFDLDYDYDKAKTTLVKNKLMKNAIAHGEGIRIAKNDEKETIIEFIISANNRIVRIQKIVEKLCEIGEKKIDQFGEYYAFPDMKVLARQRDEWFASLGAGYRAPYIKETAKVLANTDIDKIKKLSLPKLYKWLL